MAALSCSAGVSVEFSFLVTNFMLVEGINIEYLVNSAYLAVHDGSVAVMVS